MQSFDLKDLMPRLQGLDQRKIDDEIYAQIYDEYAAGILDRVAQARALEAAGGEQDKIKSEYIKFRFIRIKDDLELLQRQKQREAADLKRQTKAAEAAKQKAEQEKLRRQEEIDKNRYAKFKSKSRNKRHSNKSAHHSEWKLEQYHLKANAEGGSASWLWLGVILVILMIIMILLAI